MSTSILFMSMSLDGYISDPDDFLGGEDGMRRTNGSASVPTASPPRRPRRPKSR